MRDEGISDMRAAKYAKALKTAGIECSEELSWLIDSGGDLPDEMAITDATLVQNALDKEVDNDGGEDEDEKAEDNEDDEDDKAKNSEDELDRVSWCKSWLINVAGINAAHAQEYAAVLEKRDSFQAVREFTAKDEQEGIRKFLAEEMQSKDGMLSRMMDRSDSGFINLRMKEHELREVKGEACLRVEMNQTEGYLSISARGTSAVLVNGLVAVAHKRMCRLKEEFKGLQLGDNKDPSPDDGALDALLLIMAIRSSRIPQQLVDVVPPEFVWRMSVREVRDWCKKNISKEWNKSSSRILTVNGRGLLAMDSNDPFMHDLLKLAGMTKAKHRNNLLGTKNESGVLDKKEGLPFWGLITQQLGQQDAGSSGQSQGKDFDRRLLSYDFVRTLGNGAFGVVYQVKHRETSIAFALKDQRPPSMKAMHELKRETKLQQKAAKGQGSKFVVHCYNPFEVGLRFCMPLEFCQGGELGKWVEAQIKKEAFSHDDLRRVLTHLLDG
jgi:hypothetical protein